MSIFWFQEFHRIKQSWFERQFEGVPEFRKKRIRAYQFEKDARISLVAYLLLNYVLRKQNDRWQLPIFYYNHYGKPYLEPECAAGKGPFFNLSHTDNTVFCIVAENEVGVDVEKRIPYDPQLAETFCSEKEIQMLKQAECPSEEMTSLWVLKESYLKNLGKGFSIDPKTVDFHQGHQKEGKFFQCSTLCDQTLFWAVCTNIQPQTYTLTECMLEEITL